MTGGRPEIQIISASAGSGKTYRLAQLLREELDAERVRPEGVVAVTFTIKAAAELAERARRSLIENNRHAEAERLGAARIGTVHAVCARLIEEFAFELGLPRQQSVLDAAMASRALRQALEGAMTSERKATLAELRSRFDPKFDWQAVMRRILGKARSNGISVETLRTSRQRSREGLEELFDETLADVPGLEADVRAALEDFRDNSPPEDQTQATNKSRSLTLQTLTRLESGRSLRWADWHRLATCKCGAKSRALGEAIQEAARAHARHPLLREDTVGMLDLMYDIAADALGDYESYKLERGLIDFPDQLAIALRALALPSVQEQLAGQIDLVLVDEFQDTSPMQLAVFVKLATLAKRSIWVGDQKQAIYSFLDADPALMDAAIGAVLDGEPETLNRSWRSRPELVRLTSDLFAPPFERVGIPQSRTRLEPAYPEEPEGLGPVVERWRIEGSKKDNRIVTLAQGVREALADDSLMVRDGDGGVRPARAADVAILCRTNDTCSKVATALEGQGVPSVLPRSGLLATHEAQLVLAGLELWLDPGDRLAAAILARLTEHDSEGTGWLEATLRKPADESAEPSSAHRALLEHRQAHPGTSLGEIFAAVVEITHAKRWALAWGDSGQRLSNVEALRAQVGIYEGHCRTDRTSPSLAGFLASLPERVEAKADKRAVVAADNAVVVSTWHGAKGLEWPVTVLYDMGPNWPDDPLDVHVVQDGEDFNFDDPLAGRWIRYWPNPFQELQKSFLREKLEGHPAKRVLEERREREELRLHYVGWTRARDVLVLASGTAKKRRLEVVLEDLNLDGQKVIFEPQEDRVAWAGRELDIRLRDLTPGEPPERDSSEGRLVVPPGPRSYPRRGSSDRDLRDRQGNPATGLNIHPLGRRSPSRVLRRRSEGPGGIGATGDGRRSDRQMGARGSARATSSARQC
jgi:ATP-dependent exoDNAse (exonuclease V) beta subunit